MHSRIIPVSNGKYLTVWLWWNGMRERERWGKSVTTMLKPGYHVWNLSLSWSLHSVYNCFICLAVCTVDCRLSRPRLSICARYNHNVVCSSCVCFWIQCHLHSQLDIISKGIRPLQWCVTTHSVHVYLLLFLKQESQADAKVSARQQCVHEGPW